MVLQYSDSTPFILLIDDDVLLENGIVFEQEDFNDRYNTIKAKGMSKSSKVNYNSARSAMEIFLLFILVHLV